MMLVVCVTKGRPAAFARLVTLLDKQSVEDWDFLVVSDDWEGYKFPKKAKVLKRDSSSDTSNSLCSNWLAALDWIESDLGKKYDQIVVVEDDDYYNQNYLRETRKNLEKADLVGWQEDAYYYVLSRKARRVHNVGWASLASTAFTRAVLPYMRKVCSIDDVFIDKALWLGIKQTTLFNQPPLSMPDGSTREASPVPVARVVASWTGSRQLFDNFTGLPFPTRLQPKLDGAGNIIDEHPRHVGMKQPWHNGVEGLSSTGHDATLGGGNDVEGLTLTKWIGEEDAKFYLKFTKDRLPRRPPESNFYEPWVMMRMPIDQR